MKPNTARESERILFKSTCDAMIEQADKHNQKAIGEQLKSPRVFNAIGVVYIVEVDSTRTNQHRHWQGNRLSIRGHYPLARIVCIRQSLTDKWPMYQRKATFSLGIKMNCLKQSLLDKL